MTNEKAKALHALVSGWEDQIQGKYWAYFVPVFEWAHANGMRPTELAKELGIPKITIYKVIDTLNSGENMRCYKDSYTKIAEYADLKNIQL